MWKRLIFGLTLTISVISAAPGQYDTLYCRGRNYILLPKYDTLELLEQANIKADTILSELQKIKDKLGIADTTPAYERN